MVGVAEVGVQKLRGQWEGWAPLCSEHQGVSWRRGVGCGVTELHPEKYLLQGIEIPPRATTLGSEALTVTWGQAGWGRGWMGPGLFWCHRVAPERTKIFIMIHSSLGGGD